MDGWSATCGELTAASSPARSSATFCLLPEQKNAPIYHDCFLMTFQPIGARPLIAEAFEREGRYDEAIQVRMIPACGANYRQ